MESNFNVMDNVLMKYALAILYVHHMKKVSCKSVEDFDFISRHRIDTARTQRRIYTFVCIYSIIWAEVRVSK